MKSLLIAGTVSGVTLAVAGHVGIGFTLSAICAAVSVYIALTDRN